VGGDVERYSNFYKLQLDAPKKIPESLCGKKRGSNREKVIHLVEKKPSKPIAKCAGRTFS